MGACSVRTQRNLSRIGKRGLKKLKENRGSKTIIDEILDPLLKVVDDTADKDLLGYKLYNILTVADASKIQRLATAISKNDVDIIVNNEFDDEAKELLAEINVDSADVLIDAIKKETKNRIHGGTSISTVLSRDVTDVKGGILQYIMQVPHRQVVIDGKAVDLTSLKTARINKMEGIKPTEEAKWTAFLDTYFPNATNRGVEFQHFVEDKILTTLVSFKPARGFVNNINTEIHNLKKEISVISGKNSSSKLYMNTDIRTAMEDGNVKKQYFIDLLNNEFDFLISSFGKLIAIDTKGKQFKAINTRISGLFDLNVDSAEDVYLNLKALPKMTVEAIGEYVSDGFRLNSNVDIEIHSAPKRYSFHKDSAGRIFFTNKRGNKTYEVTPKTFYKINNKNERNSSSIDHSIDALDQDTAFINNIFPLFRYIKADGTYGERMSYNDYLYIAPRLFGINNELDAVITELKKHIHENSRMGNISRSLLYHVFSPTYKILKSTRVHSLYNIAKTDPYNVNMNSNIVRALLAALVNKTQVRFLEVNGTHTKTTQAAKDRDFMHLINDQLEAAFYEGTDIKPEIKSMIHIEYDILTKNRDIFLNISTVSKNIANITDPEVWKIIATELGIPTIYNKIKTILDNTEKDGAQADAKLSDIMRSFVKLAAYNFKYNPFNLSVSNTAGKFLYLAPSKELYKYREILEEVLQPDTTRQLTIVGNKAAATTLPSRISFLVSTIDKINEYNKKTSLVPSTFNPFIKQGLNSKLPYAEMLGTIVKAPMIHNGKIFDLPDWSKKIRIEHAVIQGMLKVPKSTAGHVIGQNMALQVVAYSDKSQIPLQEIKLSFNAFTPGKKTSDLLKNTFITYIIEKNESLQRITISKFKEFIVGNFSAIYDGIKAQRGRGIKNRLHKLVELREHLIQITRNFNTHKSAHGDMLRSINELLDQINIPTELALFSTSSLDRDVDYINMGGKLILKPSIGVRAEAYARDGKNTLNKLLKTYKEEIKNIGIDTKMIETELKAANVNLTVEEFLLRAFLINGVYGHALKTMTMGDESYFDTRYSFGNIVDYYSEADKNKDIALEDTSEMMIKQSKRAQSILTIGQRYIQKETVVGLKKRSAKDNIFYYANVRNNTNIEFSELIGKDLYELEGLGIIERLPDNSIIDSDDKVIVNVGNHRAIVSINPNISLEPWYEKIQGMREVVALLRAAHVKTKKSILYNPNIEGKMLLPSTMEAVQKRIDGKFRITIQDIMDTNTKMKSAGLITLPDYMPSILVTDPVSFIDVLNKMGVAQDNSDAIQIYHPLYYKLFQIARGGELSGFYNDKYTALKTLTTSVEYDSYRQALQKKSGQMPFSMEQFIKLGGPEMKTMFDKMNSEMEFPTTDMQLPKVDSSGRIVKSTELVDGEPVTSIKYVKAKIKNMKGLFDYFGGWKRIDESVWDDVLAALSNYGENLYSFVGILSVPTNQKTGHRKFNSWENTFNPNNKDKLILDHMANEFNFEVLSKGHDYDVSENADHSSRLALLSQLVSAVGFGGLSNVNVKLVQNAIEAMSDVRGMIIGRSIAKAAKKLHLAIPGEDGAVFLSILTAIENGDMSGGILVTDGRDPKAKKYYREIILAGLADVIENSFDESLDSPLFKAIVHNDKSSLDTPITRERLLGVLRTNIYKNAIKIQMSGFIGTVSATHNFINIYTIPETGERGGRAKYIDFYLNRIHTGNANEVVKVTPDNIKEIKRRVMPFDRIYVNGDDRLSMAHYNIAKKVKEGADVRVVLLPEKNPAVSVSEYLGLDELTKIRLIINGRLSSTYKWRADEIMKENNVSYEDLIKSGNLSIDTTDEHSLRWYEIHRRGGEDIKNTKEYRNLYRLQTTTRYTRWKDVEALNAHQIKINAATAALTQKIQEVDSAGNKIWTLTVPEVVLPTFNAAAFGIEPGTKLHEIGTTVASASDYFFNKPMKRFTLIATQKNTANRKGLIARFLKLKALNMASDVDFNTNMYDDILALLNNSTADIIATSAVDNIILRHKKIYTDRMAEAFIESLDVTLARIPGQTKQSGFAARVLEFLDSQGNASFAPTEHLVNTGGDMDIDTLSIVTKALNRDGISLNYSIFEDDLGMLDPVKVVEYLKNKNIELIDKLSTARDVFNAALEERRVELENKAVELDDSRKSIKKMNDELIAEYKDKMDALETGSKEYIQLENMIHISEGIIKKATDKLDAKEENLLNELLTIDSRKISEESLENHVDKAAKNLNKNVLTALSNALEHGVRTSLASLDTMMEVQTPISLDIFAGIKLAIEHMNVDKNGNAIHSRLEKFKHSNYSINGENFLSHFIIEDLNAKGKEAIGIYASVLKMLSAVQVAKIYYTENKRGYNDPFKYASIVKYDSPYYKRSRVLVRDTFADLEKFDILESLANSRELQQTLVEIREGKAVSNPRALEKLEEMVIKLIKDAQDNITSLDLFMTKEDLNEFMKEKIKDTLGIDLDHEIFYRSQLAPDGDSLANEFTNC
jgi:hypothetical protein